MSRLQHGIRIVRLPFAIHMSPYRRDKSLSQILFIFCFIKVHLTLIFFLLMLEVLRCVKIFSTSYDSPLPYLPQKPPKTRRLVCILHHMPTNFLCLFLLECPNLHKSSVLFDRSRPAFIHHIGQAFPCPANAIILLILNQLSFYPMLTGTYLPPLRWEISDPKTHGSIWLNAAGVKTPAT